MADQSAPTSESFTHVANLMLRGVLEAKPRQIKRTELRQALDWTLDALGRDVIADDPIPGSALIGRIAAAREADAALLNRRIAQCHRALRRFWSI
jgi:hypothetical protein